ncbi:MAG: N-acetylneuraminate synthase family protein [Candidatus Methanoperedenaceae archaeon]|nr:N-acetylneuraminate synthase family protein [Candidatus Methanoperedenaceae archaeon]
MPKFNIGRREVGNGRPTYFIADISANHDGDLARARMLIHLAAESGADAAKFQNFRAPKIVSERGFGLIGTQLSHQERWKKPVYEVYEEATLPWEWTEILKAECSAVGIEYFSTPYDFEAVDMLDPYVSLFKIGSGDITWPEMLQKVATKKKPVILATGASNIGDVQRAVQIIQEFNRHLVLMQCNTNYSGSLENFKHIHLNVLRTYHVMFPDVVLGLSDHTPGHATVLGAVALGARIVEKHFTDDTHREGPDHPFSMSPATWRDMVSRTRELEYALGSSNKQIAENEQETVVVQRRCLRAAKDLMAGTILTRELIDVLRPAPYDALFPFDIDRVLGMRLRTNVSVGEHLRWTMLESDDEDDEAR